MILHANGELSDITKADIGKELLHPTYGIIIYDAYYKNNTSFTETYYFAIKELLGMDDSP